MKAALLCEHRTPLRVVDRAIPQVDPEGVLMRVIGAGVCHTDLHIIDGEYPDLPLPIVLGHEIAGGRGLGPGSRCWTS